MEEHKEELETKLDALEQEVLDELDNPYKPFRVIFPYEVRFTIPADGHYTEVTIRTRSEELRIGRNEKDILLAKQIDDRYGKDNYSKHIVDYLAEHIRWIEPKECDLEFLDAPSVTTMTEQEVKEFAEESLKR